MKKRVNAPKKGRMGSFFLGMVVVGGFLVVTVWLLADRNFRIKADFLSWGVEIETHESEKQQLGK